MKKMALLIILIGISLGAFFVFGPQELPDPTIGESQNGREASLLPNELPELVNDHAHQVLSKVIKKDLQKTKAYKAFINPSLKTPFYLRDAKLGAEEGREFLYSTFTTLKDCFKEGCGQEPDKDGFYDASNTVAMISMKRVLEIALLDPEFLETKDWLAKDDLLGLLDAPNSKVRSLALKNLMSLYNKEPAIFNEVLRASEELSGYEASSAIEGLLPYVTKENKRSFLDALNAIAKEKDGFTVTEVLEKAESIKVEENEIKELGSELCRFSGVKTQSQNFKAMNYTLKNMATNSGINFSLKNHCP